MTVPSIRVNGGSPGVKGSVGPSAALVFSLDDTAGVDTAEWAIVSTDESTAATSYALVLGGAGNTTCATTSLARGTAGIVMVRINGGIDKATQLPDVNGTHAFAKFYVPTATTAREVMCAGETNESDATFGWTGIVNALIRAAGTVGAGGGVPTLAALQAVVGPANDTIVMVASVGASYKFNTGSAVAADSWTVLTATDGTTGRWELVGKDIYVAPMTWATLATLWAAAAAAGVAVHMLGGNWTAGTLENLPNNLLLYMHDGVDVTSTLASTGGSNNAAFWAVGSGVTASTLNGANTFAATTILVNNGALYQANDWIEIVDAFNMGAYYQVQSVSVNTLTLDRDVMYVWPSGASVLLKAPPQNIRIIGLGRVLVHGSGDFLLDISGGRDCLVEGVTFTTTSPGMSSTANLDVGAFRSWFRNCVVNGGTGAISALNLESSEQCGCASCEVTGGTACAFLVTNCFDMWLQKCRGHRAVAGLQLDSGGSAQGVRSLYVDGGSFDNNTSYGVRVINGAQNVRLVGVSATDNAVGLSITSGSPAVSDIHATNLDVSRNTTAGLAVDSGVSAIRVDGFTCRGCGSYGITTASDLTVIGGEIRETTTQSVNVTGSARLTMRDTYIGKTFVTGGSWWGFFVDTTATLDLDGIRFVSSGGGTTIAIAAPSSGYHYIANSSLSGFSYGFLATAATGGLRRGPNVDFSAASVNAFDFSLGGHPSWGTLTLSGAANVDLTFANANSRDRPRARRTSLSGTPGHFTCTVVAGVGIRIAGTALDTSTVEVDLI
jgi:hypothetical protein